MPSRRAARDLLTYAALAAGATVGHLAYPTSLWVLTRRLPQPEPTRSDELPSVSVVVAAYLESAVIAEKIADCLDNGYEGKLEVLVVADDARTAGVARDSGARVIESATRLGKSAALSAGISQASGEIVVLTDANTTLAPGSIERLIRWFGDPSVGAVAGEKRHSSGREGIYWAFESWLKQREHRLGTTIGLVGECSALRRDAAPEIPSWVVVDDFWLALTIRRAGLVVAYEPDAVAMEDPAPADEEWQRRTRIVAGAIAMLWRERWALGTADPVLSYQVWGHRMWRMTAGPLSHLALVALAANRSRPGRRGAGLARAIFVGNAALFGCAVAGERVSGPLRSVGQVGYLQLVGLGGMTRLVTGDVQAKWPKADRSTP